MSLERILVYAFPRAWRERYGDELVRMLEDSIWDGSLWRSSLDVVRVGLEERAHAIYRMVERQLLEGSGAQIVPIGSIAHREERRVRRDGWRLLALALPLAAAIAAPLALRGIVERQSSVSIAQHAAARCEQRSRQFDLFGIAVAHSAQVQCFVAPSGATLKRPMCVVIDPATGAIQATIGTASASACTTAARARSAANDRASTGPSAIAHASVRAIPKGLATSA
jgi:hypothetical protein